jgi:hypothetical protein
MKFNLPTTQLVDAKADNIERKAQEGDTDFS